MIKYARKYWKFIKNVMVIGFKASCFYYIAGPDGSGKTTHINSIKRHLHSRGIRARQIWMRSPKILSKPLMAYCRLVGLTRYTDIDGIRVGRHEFYKSKIVSKVFPWLQYMDMKISVIFKIKPHVLLKKDTFIMDRYVIDTLADLMVDTRRYDLPETMVGRKFMALLPPNSKTVILDVDESILRKRKKDVSVDPLIKEKIKAFGKIAKDMKIKIIDNNRPFGIVSEEICRIMLSSP